MARDELAGWLGGFDRYAQGKGGDAAKWLEAFGGRPLIVDRKTGDPPTIYVPRAAVSITGGIQPETLRRRLGQEHLENGLAARLLLAWPPRMAKRWTEAQIDTKCVAGVTAIFEQLYGVQPQVDALGQPSPVIVSLNPKAKQAWVKFYNEHGKEQADQTGALAAVWSKLEGYAARLALVIHQVRWAAGDLSLSDANQVDEKSIRAGVAMARWFGHEARRVYAMLDECEEERDRRRLVDLIRAKGGSISGSELVRSSRAHSTVVDAEEALDDLAQDGIGRWEQPSQPGRGRPPARRLVLNGDPVNVYENNSRGSANGNNVDIDKVDTAVGDPGWAEEGEI